MPTERDRATPVLRPRGTAQRLDEATAELKREIDRSKRCTEEMRRIAAAVVDDKISTDGVVLEPFADEDTLVRTVRATLQDLAEPDAPA